MVKYGVVYMLNLKHYDHYESGWCFGARTLFVQKQLGTLILTEEIMFSEGEVLHQPGIISKPHTYGNLSFFKYNPIEVTSYTTEQ